MSTMLWDFFVGTYIPIVLMLLLTLLLCGIAYSAYKTFKEE